MSRSGLEHDLEPRAFKNGVYPHSTFPPPRKRPRRRHLTVMDWGGAIAVGILLAGLLLAAGGVFLGGLWLLLTASDALVRRLGG